jgi:DNA-binding transcriptional MerR regulator
MTNAISKIGDDSSTTGEGGMEILGHGVYSLPDAAKLTRLKPQRVREWFVRGRTAGARASVFRSDYQSLGGDRAISFHDLIELFIAGQLRDHGVSLQTLRKVYKRLQADLGTRNPFCRREIMTKDGQVFLFGLDARGTEEMIEVLTQQRVFPDILLPFLRKMDYDEATDFA